jgi:hypothetical protein
MMQSNQQWHLEKAAKRTTGRATGRHSIHVRRPTTTLLLNSPSFTFGLILDGAFEERDQNQSRLPALDDDSWKLTPK